MEAESPGEGKWSELEGWNSSTRELTSSALPVSSFIRICIYLSRELGKQDQTDTTTHIQT